MSIFSLNKDVCQVVFKVSSDKCTVRLTGMDEGIEDYRESLAPDSKYMTNFTIKTFAVNDDGEKVMDVGFVNGVFFEAEVLFSQEISFPMLCDMVSSDAEAMAAAVTDKQGNVDTSICDPEHNMAYIKKMFIEEQCRGLGMGRYLLDNLVPLLSHSLNLHPHVCILVPYPQEKTQSGTLLDAAENAAADLPRLIRFYEKSGYTKLKGSDYMYKKFMDSLDEIFEMLKG